MRADVALLLRSWAAFALPERAQELRDQADAIEDMESVLGLPFLDERS